MTLTKSLRRLLRSVSGAGAPPASCRFPAQRVDEISCQVPRYLQQGRTVLLLDPFAFRERSKMST